MKKGAVARDGYKKTELGWIPEDWEVKRLGEVADRDQRYSFTGGPFGSDLKSEDYTETGVRIIQLQNIGDGEFLNHYSIFTSEEKANHLHSCNIYPGDIILAKMDPVARSCIIPNIHERFVMCSDGIRLSVDRKLFNRDFIFYFINLREFRCLAESKATGGTRKRIGLDVLRNLPIAFPPLPEQKKIAEILSTWDEAIEKLNSYIKAKKKLKKALMQRLLTGKQRFKEFIVREGYKKTELGWIPEDWEPLGSVFDIFAGGDVPKDVFAEVETEELKVPIFSNGVGEKSLYGWTDKPKINKPSLTVSARGTIGWTSYRDQPFVPVVRLLVLTPKIEMNLKYAYYFMKTIESNYKVSPAGIPQLTKPMIESVKIPLPPLPEQKKIAEILSKVDEEIDLLNQELEKLKTQKKGLMQKLLTGAWRVKL